MKKATRYLALASAIAVMGSVLASAQPIPTPAPPPAAPATNVVGAKIQFANTLHEFGRVKSGEPVRYTYIFTNIGDEVLSIKSVQPQCGCTAAGEWTKEVAPGKTGQIPIQFNSTGYNGPVFKQVTVTCNVSNQQIVILQLKGVVFKQIDIMPAFVALTVPADSAAAAATVSITNNSDEPLTLSPPESSNKALTATLVTNVPGKSFQLQIHTADPLQPGSAQTQISMHTSLTNMAVLNVPVYVNVQPPIVIVPARISVQPAPLTAAVTNSVTIQNNSTNALTLSEPTVNFPGVTVEIHALQPGHTFSTLIGFPQGFELPPGQHVELTIKSSNPKMPLLKIPVSQIPRASHAAAKPTPPPLPPGQ